MPIRRRLVTRMVALALFCLPIASLMAEGESQAVTKPAPSRWEAPFHFQENRGLYDSQVRFFHRGSDHTFFLTDTEMVTVFTNQDPRRQVPVLRLQLAGSRAGAAMRGQGLLASKSHYFIGNRPEDWVTGVAHYQSVYRQGVYPGIDLVYYGRQGAMEYDFRLQPGADPSQIVLDFEGADAVVLSQEGHLELVLDGARVRQVAPIAYQESEQGRHEVPSRFEMRGADQVGFRVGPYDAQRPLVIDPIVLVYSTYLGGSDRDIGHAVAVAADGSAYITGETSSDNFPTISPLQATPAGNIEAFVSGFDPSGTLMFSTYLGGGSGDIGEGIAVDPLGNIYVTGNPSVDFPTTPGVLDSTRSGPRDAFVAKLSPNGATLMYSTFLGGSASDEPYGLTVDGSGNAYVVGRTSSSDFPVSGFQETFGGNTDAFLAKLNPTGTALVYSTYLGGSGTAASGRDSGADVAVDSARNAYVIGSTGSDDFPVTAGVFQGSLAAPGQDVFITKVNPDGQGLAYSTLLGSTRSDSGSGIAIDQQGNAYLTGVTSFDDFPTRNPIQAMRGGIAGDIDGFISKLSADGSDLVYSTFLGGQNNDRATSIAVDGEGNALVTGTTFSPDFPVFDALPTSVAQTPDAFVTKVNALGTSLVYSTTLGGADDDSAGAAPGGGNIAVDLEGSAYVTGDTGSADFPLQDPFQGTYGGGDRDGFLTKISETFTQYFAQFGNGGGLTSDVVLNNPSIGNRLSGHLDLTNDDGLPLILALQLSAGAEAQIDGNRVDFSLPALGALTISTDGTGAVTAGAATVTSNGAFGGLIRFSIPGLGTTGVAGGQAMNGFLAPVRRTPQGINTGIAVQNTTDQPISLELSLRDNSGTEIAAGQIENLPAHGHLAQFITELFSNLPASLDGVLVVQAVGGQVAATALEQGPGPGEFTTLPVTPVG